MPLAVDYILRTLPITASTLSPVAWPFTPEDLVQTNRLRDTVVSPGNTAVAYIQSQYSIDSKLCNSTPSLASLHSLQPFTTEPQPWGTVSIDRQEKGRADTAQVYEILWVCHWDTFTSPKPPQIHTLKLVSTSDNSFKPKGQPRNIIKDTEADGRLEASDSFGISPNGLQVAFVAKKPGKDYAWKTTSFVYLADVDGSAAAPINPSNGGASSSPSFNHNGTKIAYV
ncbi:dipeptidylpeptidase [Coemansia sp. RSA 986]|nr:dipeptidylpeptidase [Coemansia sp. RSA 986]